MRVLRRLGDDLAAFIHGHDHAICVLTAERDHLPWVYATLQELDTATPDLFLPFPHPCESTRDYAQTVVDLCLQCVRSHDPNLQPPPTCLSPGASPAARVCAALEFARDHLLTPKTCPPRLVAILAPLTVECEDSLLDFTRELLTRAPGFPPWFYRLRIFVHLPRAIALPSIPAHARALPVDLSPAALAADVRETALDPAAPPDLRIQALLQAAALDAAAGRHEAAIASYRDLYAQATQSGNHVLAALALAGQGDIASAQQDILKAITWYERALVPASATGSALLMLLVTRNLAHLYFERGRHTDAELFYDGAQRLAMAVPDADSHIDALTWRGKLEELRGAREQAATTFLAAARVAREYGHPAQLARLTARLADHRNRVSPPLARAIAEFLEAVP